MGCTTSSHLMTVTERFVAEDSVSTATTTNSTLVPPHLEALNSEHRQVASPPHEKICFTCSSGDVQSPLIVQAPLADRPAMPSTSRSPLSAGNITQDQNQDQVEEIYSNASLPRLIPAFTEAQEEKTTHMPTVITETKNSGGNDFLSIAEAAVLDMWSVRSSSAVSPAAHPTTSSTTSLPTIYAPGSVCGAVEEEPDQPCWWQQHLTELPPQVFEVDVQELTAHFAPPSAALQRAVLKWQKDVVC